MKAFWKNNKFGSERVNAKHMKNLGIQKTFDMILYKSERNVVDLQLKLKVKMKLKSTSLIKI